MKKIILSILLMFVGLTFANDSVQSTQEQALKIANKFQILFTSPKVNGVGVTLCNKMGGKQSDFNKRSVICVLITVDDEDSANSFEQLYPLGTKVEGFFITVNVQERLKL